MMHIFMTRSFWLEMEVQGSLVHEKYQEYLGNECLVIDDRDRARTYLLNIINKLNKKFLKKLKDENPQKISKDLYKILDSVWDFYIKQKEARSELSKLKINDDSAVSTFSTNRNMALNVIDAINLWIENCVLYQDNIEKPYSDDEVNKELFVELYIYGLVSRALSLITMSKKFEDKKLFYGVKVDVSRNEPLEILKYHPIVYFNTLLVGNQNVFSMTEEEIKKANYSEFGVGFYKEYGLPFLNSLALFLVIQNKLLKEGRCPFRIVDKAFFLEWINKRTKGLINAEKFFDCFVLTENNVKTHLRNNDPIIWIMGANKYRHEIRPIICYKNEQVCLSYAALEQAKQLWLSILSNGGMAYSKSEDKLTEAIKKRNEQLSEKLVCIIREKLQSRYVADLDEINVRYYRIFGEQECDYGDYDLVFYSKQSNELFLIEAKFFSDSLNNSGVISDYEKLFKKDGYYDHCRNRYDLLFKNPQKIKDFIGATGEIKVHCLFVSSKPLEIDFQDDDKIVTFLCLSNFDDYLDEKLLPEIGDIPVRPVHII